jgi:hypothetical protein
MTKNMREVCQLDSNPLIQSLSSSLNGNTSRFFASIDRCIKHEPKRRMWLSKEKVLAVSILKCGPRTYAFLWLLFPLTSRRILHFLLNIIQFRMGRNAHVFIIVKDNIHTMSDKVHLCCLMFDEKSIRSLTVLEALRTLEAMAGQAIFRIMPWSSYSVVYVES